VRRHWPIASALAIYWLATAVLVVRSRRYTGGLLVYPIDDAYVHMAIARNVALNHVWGVTRHGFTSATSSPLWTLLLTLTYMVIGVLIGRVMEARSADPRLTLVVLVATIFIAPLPTLTMTAMEHALHALTTLCFAFVVARRLASDRAAARSGLAVLGLLAALLTGLRYEGIFTICVAALLFVLNRRVAEALLVSIAGAVPVLLYGLWSMSHGWYLLPNSVLLKGHAPELTLRALLAFALGAPALRNLLSNPHMMLLVVVALALLVVAAGAVVWTEDVYLLAILIGTTLLHMQLASTGWFYRYEAYLLILGAAVFGVIAADWLPPIRDWARGAGARPRLAAVVVLLAVASFPFASRGLNAWRNTPTAAANIYSQQYQMGLFAERFYADLTIAVNDIGAVGYLADVKMLDIFGLANLDIARLKRSGTYNSRAIASLADRDDVAIAMVYASWLDQYGGIPPGWDKVGEWGVPDNVVLGDSIVSFFAVKKSERTRLIENLRAFGPQLPPRVVQAGEYMR
jgi:hypothetical protein